MADSYLDGDTFWCYETPPNNPVYTRNRIRCANLIINNCAGGGLPGDCNQTTVNNGLILCDPEDSWNCNLCGNDLPYFSPVRETDPMMFQFQQWDYINGQSPTFNWNTAAGWGVLVDGAVFDCCTDTAIGGDILSYSLENFIGIYGDKQYNGQVDWTNIQQISLDLAAIKAAGEALFPNWDGCFYFKFDFFNAVGDVVNSFTSEPFKFEKCDPDGTIFLEGVYSKKDCFGFFYKPIAPSLTVLNPGFPPSLSVISPYIGLGTPFQYRNTYRVKGSFELNGFEINKEFVGVKQFTANTETAENWFLRTNRLPPRVARLISNILAADTVYVEGRDYISSGTITKNNEIGNQWFLESQLKRVQCSSTNSCN
jgi:hypothetical protein